MPTARVQPPTYPLRTISTADGTFHFVFVRSELNLRWLDDLQPAVLAVADGYGPDWAEIGEPVKAAQLSLRLAQDLPVVGRILDQDRKPVAGVTITVSGLASATDDGSARLPQANADPSSSKAWMGPLPQRASAVTGVDGQFRMTGLGRDRIVSIEGEGPAIQDLVLTVATLPVSSARSSIAMHRSEFEHVARASRALRGVVRDQTTGKPVAGVKMTANLSNAITFTDMDGRFEIRGCPKLGGYGVFAKPQAGQPYFACSVCLNDGPGLDPLNVDFDLGGGIPLQGRVVDLATQKPPKKAIVEYYPLFPNHHSSKILTINLTEAPSSATVEPDGSFRLIVLPGPGVVCVAASPRNRYAVALVESKELASLGLGPGQTEFLATAVGELGRGTLDLNKYHAVSLINPNNDLDGLKLDLVVQPAGGLLCTVVGPDGTPLTGVEVIGLTAMPRAETLESASCTINGLNPRRARHLFFHHVEKHLGKFLTIRGDEPGPLTVRLDPCGSITGRLVDQNGKPLPKRSLYFQQANTEDGTPALADSAGWFRAFLVPGVKYRLIQTFRGPPPVNDVQVESGQSRNLGDLVLRE